MINLKINENDSGQRLDRFLRKYFRNAPLSYIYKLIRTELRVNGKRPTQKQVLQTGDQISIGISEEEAAAYLDKKPPASLGLMSRSRAGQALKSGEIPAMRVVYEDDNILVVDKPAGLLTHETKEEKVLVLSNQVISYLMDKGEYRSAREKVFRPGPANRLDRNTSGLVCFGKNAEATRALAQMFREKRSLDRYYLALVQGKIEGAHVLTGFSEAVSPASSGAVSQDVGGATRPALSGKEVGSYMETHVEALEGWPEEGGHGGEEQTLVEAMLVTGRTHQIRKQLAEIGHPIVGDVKYGGKKAAKAREGKTEKYQLYLHGWRLVFNVCPDILKNLEGQEIISNPPWDGRQK